MVTVDRKYSATRLGNATTCPTKIRGRHGRKRELIWKSYEIHFVTYNISWKIWETMQM